MGSMRSETVPLSTLSALYPECPQARRPAGSWHSPPMKAHCRVQTVQLLSVPSVAAQPALLPLRLHMSVSGAAVATFGISSSSIFFVRMRSSSLIFLAAAAAASASGAPCSQPLIAPATCCTKTSPATFNVDFVTTNGTFTLHVERAWAPIGVDRFYNM